MLRLRGPSRLRPWLVIQSVILLLPILLGALRAQGPDDNDCAAEGNTDCNGNGAGIVVATDRNRVALVGRRVSGNQETLSTAGHFPLLGESSRAGHIRAGDIDDDGNADVLVAYHRATGFQILWGLGDQTFSEAQLVETPAAPTTNMALADVDGDGDLDVILSTLIRGGPCTATSENLGGRRFGPRTPLTSAVNPIAVAMQVADFNDDGQVDVVLSSTPLYNQTEFSPGLFISFGDEGALGPLEPVFGRLAGHADLHCADVDDDGRVDIIQFSRTHERVFALLNRRSGADGRVRFVSASPHAGTLDDVQSIRAFRVKRDDPLRIAVGDPPNIEIHRFVPSTFSLDCNGNEIPDECDELSVEEDCDGDGLPNA